MKPANLLFILSDEHNPRVLGCSGHPMIRTPNLDRLAAKGVRFSDAYCNSPICVPSHAAPIPDASPVMTATLPSILTHGSSPRSSLMIIRHAQTGARA
jgi:Sulfatase